METSDRDNEVLLCGSPAGEALYSHSARSERFYTLPFAVKRLSGAADTLNLTLRASALASVPAGVPLEVEGELRSFNSRRGDWPRLVISVFARGVRPTHEEDENLVAEFLSRNGSYRLAKSEKLLPDDSPRDGAYAALLQKDEV